MATKYKKHVVIPDTQVKPGVPTDHLKWLGRYIADQKPDTVIHLGDHWDFPSLSEHDDDKPLLTEGQDTAADVKAGNDALALLSSGFRNLKCRRVLLRGNHEYRLERAREKSPRKLRSLFGEHLFNDRALGWEPIPFKKIVMLDGIAYCHFFYNTRTGKPYGGTAMSMLPRVGHSFIQGHRQGLDTSGEMTTALGERRRGIIAGSFYQHREEYLGPQSNEWRGVLVLHEVRGGTFDLMEVSLEYLRRRYG